MGEFFHKTLRGSLPKILSGSYVKEVGRQAGEECIREAAVKIFGNRWDGLRKERKEI
jgi:hypothetical protein